MKSIQYFFTNQSVVLTMVLLNALIMFVGGCLDQSYGLHYIDDLFTVYFLIEVICKSHSMGWNTYWKDGWNRFDFIITMVALPTLITLIYPSLAIDTSVFLSLRVLRVLKVLLIVRFIPNISSIINGLRNALLSSVVVIVGFLVLTFTMSIISFGLFGHIAPEYFGNPLEAFYTTFRLFTVEGWYEIPNLIAQRSGTAVAIFAKVYFSLLLFGGGIIGLSLVNSIFVDAMAADNNDELIKKIEELEKKIDQLNKNS